MNVAIRLGGLTVAAVLAAACNAKPQVGNEATPSPSSSAAASSTRWVSGHRYDYRFSLASSTQLGAAPPSDLRISGRLSLAAREHAPGAQEFSLELADVERGEGSNPVVEALVPKLNQPFAFTLEKGRITGFRVAKGGDAEAANVLRTLSSALQCADRTGTTPTWSVDEYDSTGKYSAEYRFGADASKVVKRKVQYEALTLGGDGLSVIGATPPKPDVAASEATFTLRDGTVAELRSKDTLTVPFQGATVTSTTEISLDLSADEANAAVDWPALADKTRPLGPGDPYVGPPRPNAAFDEQRIGSFTYETALKALEKVSKDSPAARQRKGEARGDEKERTDWVRDSEAAFVAMCAILRTQPNRLPDAKRVALSGRPVSDWVADAMASAGTDQAQAALIEVVENRRSSLEHRASAVGSLIRVEQPSDATVDWLIRTVSDRVLGEAAVYGLGTASRKLREAGLMERSERAERELLRLLSVAADKPHRIAALEGLGNSGAVEGLESIRGFLKDQDPAMRAASVESLRLIEDPRVDELVAASMSDSEPEVRLAALTAVKARNPSPLLAARLKELMLNDTKTTVRGKAIRIAKIWIAKRPELRPVLETIASGDQNAALRKEAKDSLGS